jgi:hypothetical protein
MSVQVPGGGTVDQRWKQVQDQIARLDAKQTQIFSQLRQLYTNEAAGRRDVSREQ